jgi:hypothetical protein
MVLFGCGRVPLFPYSLARTPCQVPMQHLCTLIYTLVSLWRTIRSTTPFRIRRDHFILIHRSCVTFFTCALDMLWPSSYPQGLVLFTATVEVMSADFSISLCEDAVGSERLFASCGVVSIRGSEKLVSIKLHRNQYTHQSRASLP